MIASYEGASGSSEYYPGVRTLGIEWHEDEAVPVPIQFFDHDGVDSIEDRFREALECPGECERLLASLLEQRAAAIRAEAIQRLMGEVMVAKKKTRTFFQICLAAGLVMERIKDTEALAQAFGVPELEVREDVDACSARLGLSMADVARDVVGTSKQAVQQGVKRQQKRYGFRQTRFMRSDEARERMRLRNSRRNKTEVAK